MAIDSYLQFALRQRRGSGIPIGRITRSYYGDRLSPRASIVDDCHSRVPAYKRMETALEILYC